jgi:UDP-N-acetylglucosamine acyltransferase
MLNIHPTALVDAGAELDADVQVGPYAVVGPQVRIGAGSKIGAHCVIDGPTTIGRHNTIFPHAALGAAPQDKKYAGEPTRLEIGDHNTIREFCTFNRGTTQDQGVTRIGHHNWIMAYVHIAHDCQVGSHTILANNATLAGHVHLGDYAIIGGLTGVHQFCKLGAHVITGFQSHVAQDVPPFLTVAGNPLAAHGINAEGLKRRQFSPERVAIIKQMYRLLYRQGMSLADAVAAIEALQAQQPPQAHEARADISHMLQFLAQATRGIVR